MSREATLRCARTAAALMVALIAGAGCTPLDDAMVAIFGRSMRDSRSFDPYENPRLPAENAIPFGVGNYAAGLDGPGITPAGVLPPFAPPEMSPPGSDRVRSLENPMAADDASLERGRVLYDRFCTVCHGSQGLSAEAPILERLPQMAAWNLATGTAPGYTDGYIYGMIRQGRGGMPAYGHRIPDVDRWHVVNYVRHLQQQAAGDTAGAAGEGES